MMKKSLLAVSLLSALTGSAMAADVTLYGRADLGLVYTQQKQTSSEVGFPKDVSKTDAFTMESGNGGSSRFGLTGNEELGNGLTVNFLLENGFKADSGELGGAKEGRIFDREASVGIRGDFGTIRTGRMANILSGAGSMGFYAGTVSPFGTGWGTDIYGHANLFADQVGVLDNAIGYISPSIAGVTVYAQYGMGAQGAENTADTNRYAALGAKYVAGPLQVATAIDWENKKSVGEVVYNPAYKESLQNVKDAYTFNLGGSYDFGYVKPYVAMQYFKNASDVANIFDKFEPNAPANAVLLNRAKGWGLNIGATAPAFGGNVMFSTGFMDGEFADPQDPADVYAYAMSAAYTYSLSKRTTVYAAMGYNTKEAKGTDYKDELETYQAAAGLIHTF